ncbi:hypothetical protein [Streptomyces atacamensis]|uniref:hypothetical protein n=1 Tax=Streptomyces atacamensis TaxID=531966 RepID=UPI00399D56A4
MSTIVRAVRPGLPSDLGGLNESLSSLGWSPVGSTAPPRCVQWEAEGIRLYLFEAEGGWFGDAILREFFPGDVDERGIEALEEAWRQQSPFLRKKSDELASRVSEYASVSASEELSFEDCDFVEWREWRIEGWPLAVGISGTDVDVPVTVVARVGLSPNRL